jgi:ammonia channel protein AmtB
MKVLLLSCLFYLIGITVVLYIKPNLMFQDNGNWKEFGVNQDSKHTWFPFWLFCISWAFVSYGLSSFTYYIIGSETKDESNNVIELNNKTSKKNNSKNSMKSGYYVLDKEAYEDNGIPKYIFLGSEAPNQND